ncbi:type VI secretion system Vgr family protein [Desulfobulbus elongatus]|uniref:type VI secretion system Vgr family protein n=1 Tax=Desulfobulbus elongatus TaxID=53332 RepID=UPI00068478BE|nr:type VI secretion system tip protein TssI/VgrG [Desulfobulbus elongatus]
MQFLTKKRFDFVSSATPKDSLGVVHFTGTEGLSFLYEFDITLVTDNPDLDLDAVLRQPATFTIQRPNNHQTNFHGIVAHFEQLHEYNGYIFYRALLRPRAWRLTLTRHNQVCLNLPIVSSSQDSVLGRILKDGGLSDRDYVFRMQKNYASLEYVCQYGESHYDFMARWLEREGLYYFFEQTASGEQLVITDSALSHVDLPQQEQLLYAPASGMDAQHRDEVIKVLTCRQRMLPQTVRFKDYSSERPTLDLSGTAEVDPKGWGETYVYGEYFSTPKEGNRLAAIHAEALLCRKVEFHGESTVPSLCPGFTFALAGHYRRDCNRKYLITEVRHEGNQTGYLVAGLRHALADLEQTVSYRNSFTAIPAEVQYRAERSTKKPRIAGTLHATIDAEGSGQYAELDDQGRYKVRLPFDLNDGHAAGKASCFVRMAQPYAGPDGRGMHFPLPKGTLVLLTFIDGDPDRPVIAAAIPNLETPSPSTATNQTVAMIRTAGGNEICLQEQAGQESIVLESPTADSWLRLGAPYGGSTHDNGANGIRLHTKEKLWIEATERFGEYRTGRNTAAPKKSDGETVPKTGDLLANFDSAYKPSGMLSRHGGAAQQWSEVVNAAHVSVSSLDTVNTQEGNIYDFGGYWVYNLGNCYVENHMDQKAGLNAVLTHDLLVDKDGNQKGGPNYTKLSFPTLKDEATADITGTWKTKDKDGKDEDASWKNGGIWVEKKVGDSYDYVKGDAVAVAVGSSLNIRHGGRHVEVSYRDDGSLASWSWKEGGVSDERVWDKHGTCLEHRTADFNNATSSKTVYDRNTKIPASYSTMINSGSGLASFEVTFVGSATNKTYLGGKFESTVVIGASIDTWFGLSKLQIQNDKFQYHGLGFSFKKDNNKAKITGVKFGHTDGEITRHGFKLKEEEMSLERKGIAMMFPQYLFMA